MNDRPGVGERGLDERLEALRPGLDLLGLPACVIDRELRYCYVNEVYARQTGIDARDFVGRTADQVFRTPPSDERRAQMQRALAGESVSFLRQTIEGPQAGSWVRAHYLPLRGDHEDVLGVMVVLVDVQQLKDTEDALAERERHLSLIMDAVGFPVTYVDRSGVIRFANRPSWEWSGRTPDTMIGRHMSEVAPPQVLDATRALIERALAGEAVTYEREALWPGREKRHIRGHMIPDRDASGQVRGVLIVLLDIEKDYRLQEALLGQRKQLQLVTDNIGVPISYIDRERRFRFANQPGYDWRVPTPAEAMGKRLDEVFDAETMAFITPEVDRAFAGEKRVYERLAKLKAGTDAAWVRVHLVPDFDPEGAVQGVYSFVVDVDEDHRLREALTRQEAQLRHFAENIPGPIAVVDADLRYVFANKVFQRNRGLTLEELVGRRVIDVAGAEYVARHVMPNLERLRRGETCTFERLITAPNGDQRWHLVRLAPILDSDGRYNGYYAVGSDIHDMKLAEERLREREAQLRLYTDNIPEAVAYLDRNRIIHFVNRHFAEQRGMRPEDIVGKTTAEVMGTEMAAWIKERTQRVFERGETVTYERSMTLPDGQAKWLHVKAVPHLDDKGDVRGMYVVGHDISEVKEAQEKLAAREEELRFFAENIPEAIAYSDLERGTTFVNNVFLATRGLPREAVENKFPEDFYGEDVLHILDPHLEHVKRGEERSYERLARTPSGEERWMRVRLTPRRDVMGIVRGYYVVSTDIHELKVAQEAVEDKERQLRQVIDSIPTPMCYCDADRRYRYVNHAFLEYMGKTLEQVIGRTTLELVGEERWAAFEPIFQRVKEGESVSVERPIRYADGHSRWMTVSFTPRHDANGRFVGFYAITSDIHEQKAVEQELRRTNSVLSAHFDNTPLAVIEWDTELRIVRWSGQAESIFGWHASEALGRALSGWRLVYEEDESAMNSMVQSLVEGSVRHATLLHRNYRKDGSVIWVEWHNSALRDDSGRVISILSLAQDVSSRIQAEERLQYMATHDGLTGLPNSVLLNDRLAAALSRARRARRRVGVMFLDLDHFKDVNDTLGHRVGDGLLKELSQRIRAALRQSDVLARISGDEFVVVLEDLPDEEAPERVARKILEEVRRPFRIEGHEIHVSGSLGLALHPDDGVDPETLLKNADAAMYHAKELGRNSFRLFSSELAARRTRRMEIETALRRALRNAELSLHFQPIVDIATGEVKRAEALLRWHDPERGLVLPAGFIPLAEESGLGHAIGHWVLQAACRQARAWRDAGLGDITVCVNLSAGQLRDTAMIEDLKRILGATGCEPGWLQFEITETSMVRDIDGVSQVLEKLRTLGVRIAIDDFGTGFSSLSHLRHLPVDALKIDKAFVADIGKASRARSHAGGAAIVSAVIGLARGLGLDVVAEGVEKQSQLDFLEREGCRACQGYFLCEPLPAEEFDRWMRSRRARAARKTAKPAPRKPAAKARARRKVRA